MLGQVVSISTYKNTQNLDVEIIGAAGLYLATVTTMDGKKATIKITKY